jgi:TP901 family phage tail tape measure protein
MKKASFNAGLLGTGLHALGRAAHFAGLSLLAAGAAGTVAGISFEQEMAKVGSVVRLTHRDYANLSQMALDESTKTRFSAIQAADAMYLLGRAGFNANQIMRALPGTLALAHASGIDLASAARIQTEALRGFNLEAGETGRVADVLAKATQGGNVSMADLQYTIKYVGAASFTTGQKMEDMVGLIEAMARHGIRGTQAGTSLRTMLTRLIDPVKQTRDGLAMLGLKSRDLYGPHGLLPLPKIIEKIREQMKKLDPVSANRAVHKISGQWAYSGISTILNTDPKVVAKLISDLNNARGTAKKMADTLNDTVQMQLLRMWHTLESIGIGIYMAFRIPIKNALKDVNNALQPFVLQMQIIQMFIRQGDWHFLVLYLDNMTHSGGKLSQAIFLVADALKVAWYFVKDIVLPVAKQWAIILGGALYLALKGLVAIMRIANRHTSTAKFLIGLLVLAYLHWKVYTLAVVAVTKVLAFWEAVQLFRTRMLKAATIAWIAVVKLSAAALWLYEHAWLYLNLAMEANPILLIVTGLVLLGIALYLAYTRVKWFHDAVDSFFNFLWDHWELIALVPVVGQLAWSVGMIVKHWDTLIEFFKGVPDRMRSAVGDIWGWLKDSFRDALNWIIRLWNSVAGKFAFHTPNIPGTNTGGIDFGGLPKIGEVGQRASGRSQSAPVIRQPTNVFPPKTLDPKGPGDPSKNPLINPTITVISQIDGREVARATNKHNADKKARR